MPIPASQVLTAEVSMLGNASTGGSNGVNLAFVFHYKRTTNVAAVSKSALNTVFTAGPVAALLLALNERYSQTQNLVRWIDDAEDLPTSFAASGVGAVTGDSMPTTEAVYFLLRTALRGRNYRGSKHFGPISESDSTDDVITGTGLTRWQAVRTALSANLTDANGNVWQLAVFSRTLSQSRVNPTNIISNPVQSVLLNQRVGIMRKRKVKSVY